MKPYGQQYFKFKDILRSKTKTAKLIAKNAERSLKKSVRRKSKLELKILS